MKTGPYIVFFALLVALSLQSTAQESEESLRAKALALFENEDFEASGKIYSTLLSSRLQDPEYNFRFGACQLFTIQDKEEPLKYLKFATEGNNPPPLAHFYYALGLHLNYRFDKAIEQYGIYKTKAGKKDKELGMVDRHVEQCQHGKALVSSFTDISVVQRSVLPRADFYRNYDLSDFGGKIIVKPEDFMSEEDKRRDATFLMYFKQDAELIYYGSYSDKNVTGKDLYYIQKLPTGGWSEAKKLSETINTPYDEDYPFIHPEGDVLYFASKGHNSMGGYDIFKSTRRGDGTWTPPVNMEFAINTPWDDFMFITDLQENTAWFASNRENSNTQVTVYRIGLERMPLDLTLIKGVFEHEGSKKAKITVEDMVQNKVVGVYESDRQLGGYLLDIKGSGKYKFLIEAEESEAIHSGIVEIPRDKGLKQFRQEMRLAMVDGKEQLQIINHFDDPIEDEQLLTAEILKKQASLSVNATATDISKNSATKTGAKPSVDQALPQAAQLKLAQTAVKELETETREMNNLASSFYATAKQSSIGDGADDIAKAAIAAELATIYRVEAEKREVALERMKGTLSVLESGGLDDNAFSAQYNQLAATKNNFKQADRFDADVKDILVKRLDPTLSNYATKKQEVETLKSNIESIDGEIAYYEQEIANTKDKDIKAELQSQIDDAKQSKPTMQAELDRAQSEFVSLEAIKKNADNYLSFSDEIIESANSERQSDAPPINSSELGLLSADLTKKANDNPALLAMVDPEAAATALETNLSQARKQQQQEALANASANSSASTNGNTNNTETNSTANSGTAGSTGLNEQIKAIEAAPAQTSKVGGDYDAYFQDQLTTSANAEDPIIAESRKAEIYDQWAENIALRIDSLENEKRAETDPRKLVVLDDQIQALRYEKTAKEEMAMTSYQRIADLSDEADSPSALEYPTSTQNEVALSETNPNEQTSQNNAEPDNEVANNQEQNNTTTNQTAATASDQTAATTSDQPGSSEVTKTATANASEGEKTLALNLTNEDQLPPNVSQINASFTQQLAQYESVNETSDTEVRLQKAEVYSDWASALQTELVALSTAIDNAPDQEEKNRLNTMAEDLSDLRLSVVQQATDIRKSIEAEENAVETQNARTNLQNQLYEYVDNYNQNAFTQIESQISEEKNPAVREAQQELLYKNWMVAIQNERVKTEARLSNTADPRQKEELNNKLVALNETKLVVAAQLEALEQSDETLAGPQAPATVKVKGSERFEGYIPVENAVVEVYTEKSAADAAQSTTISNEIKQKQAELETTKKKKDKAAIQAEIDAKDAQLKTAEMKAAFYAEASSNLSSAETQVLTMSEGDLLPSEIQRERVQQLSTDADNATQNARIAMEDAESIKKKKQREPAVAEATKLQNIAAIKRQEADLAKQVEEEMRTIEERTITENFIILPGKEVVLPVSNKRLNPNEKTDIAATDEFKTYTAQKEVSNELRREIARLEQLERQYTQRGQQIMEESATAPAQSDNGISRTSLAEQAFEDFKKADSLSALAAQATRKATFIENEANRSLLKLPEEAYMNILAYYSDAPPALATEDTKPSEDLPPIVQRTPIKEEVPSPKVDELAQGEAFKLNAPVVRDNSRMQIDYDVLTQTIFEVDNDPVKSAYSSANPIPVNPPMPPGILYKVQIGAFRNPIEQDVFKGITPIIGETTTAGFIRYSAGEFSSFAQADGAKNKIQGIGYQDAFVVAYLNGQRITIAQARAVESGAPISSITPTRQSVGGPQRPAGQPSGLIEQGPLKIEPVSNSSGTYFTVQVGVYSRPVTSSEIFNITSLIEERLPGNRFRYTTGKYADENIALRARDEARALGVTDAFVTAYRDGVRVAVEAARNETTVPATPIRTQPTTPVTQNGTTGAYRILLGRYVGDVPVREASQILLLSGEGVDKISNSDGSSSYYYGTFNSREAAEERVSQLKQSGLDQAVIEGL